MEKKDACDIINGLLYLFNHINIRYKGDLNGILIELTDVFNTNRESITQLSRYLKNIGLPDLRDAMNLYNYISFIDKLFTLNSNNFTMKDYDNIYVSLKNTKDLLNKEKVGRMSDESAIKKMKQARQELFIDDIFRKIEIDKLTTEQLIALYGKIFMEIEKRMMSNQ